MSSDRWRLLGVCGLFLSGIAGYLAQREPSAESLGRGAAGRSSDAQRERAGGPVEPEVAVAQREEPRATERGSRRAARDAAQERTRRNQLGVDAVAAGELDRAIEIFERLVKEAPDEGAFQANLAHALTARARACRAADGALADCIVDLEQATELLPEEQALADWLARWRRELDLEAGFASADSPYFELTFDGGRGELVHSTQQFLDRLEAAYTDFRLWFGHDPVLDGGRRPFRVVLYERADFEALTGLGDWAGGAFDGTIRLPIESGAVPGQRWTAVLRHELVHGFIEELGGRSVPGWLNEGLAQWLEGVPGERVSAARGRLARADLFALEDLGGSLLGWGPDKIRVAYAQSLAWVDYLAAEHGSEALLRMVRGCKRGVDVAVSFESWTRIPLEMVWADFARQLAND